ncbi:response regulator [Pseudotabrizicola sp. L79]|uniref:response regulator n=1 Tax=Pseudotabrizicola sp. L79 TaxID=3118402 RepID=UPI002F92D7DC
MKQPRIIHVDDCQDIRMLVQIALETVAGLVLVQFESGEDAVKEAEFAEADVFLLDVMMPGLTGPQTFERLRAIPKFASTPAIFLTAKATQKELKELDGPGVIGTITKPFDAMLLGEQVVALWQAHAMNAAA